MARISPQPRYSVGTTDGNIFKYSQIFIFDNK